MVHVLFAGCRVTLLLHSDLFLYHSCIHIFTNSQRQEERTGKYGTPRVEYLQELVTQFQNASSEETKEKIVANLANFAYDPYNFTFLRQVKKLPNEYCIHRIFLVSCPNISCDVKQLNVIELFLDCLTEPNEKLVEFGIGGICNACADPANAALVTQNDGIPLIVQCLSSPVRSTKVPHRAVVVARSASASASASDLDLDLDLANDKVPPRAVVVARSASASASASDLDLDLANDVID
ncbi:hypothetical protein MTR67_017031 [Solanum verrucosum]|uniref:Armadillo repeat-containing protein n=1 Tax=Solanum verrucosum TaxID=315347 RepID=A0AAF0TL46_SOLVR|nr:hypothetical protein MTR67_017031 [Solanum verrucosum]